ncbi:YaiI/YqxD family protein [Paenibacillus algorifonticola]|uniref:YaiI/YqxD family protein n=1 Tax=Paenibacillus algorifonticola TaxID=684063 RepID=UPI0039E1F360
MKKPTIIVDGDACPVKVEIKQIARSFSLPVLMVSSYDHHLEAEEGVSVVQVEAGKDSVDMYIVNHLLKGDVVVTQDFGLACIALGKGALVLSPRGEQYTDDNIDYLMERRHEQAKRRRSGGKSKGPKAMTTEDRDRFQQKMTKVLQSEQEKHDI